MFLYLVGRLLIAEQRPTPGYLAGSARRIRAMRLGFICEINAECGLGDGLEAAYNNDAPGCEPRSFDSGLNGQAAVPEDSPGGRTTACASTTL